MGRWWWWLHTWPAINNRDRQGGCGDTLGTLTPQKPQLEGLPEHEDIVVIAMEEVGRAWRGKETGGEAWSVVVKQNGAEHRVYIVREQ